MRLRLLLLVSASLLVVLVPDRTALAARFWHLYISVDGKPAFRGGTGASPFDNELDTFVQAGIQLGPDSLFDETAIGDLELTGDVVFRAEERSPIHMQRLRLVYKKDMATRLSGTTVVDGYYDWRLHPDDAAAIAAHYRREDSAATAIRTEKSVGVFLLASALAGCFLWWQRRRKRSNQRGSLRRVIA